ncbi:hypothetical protein [Agathobaculum sp. Marseille-P7918]|uniref:hypothetical protein n=1 Tax=Agathobaculum sp. Marseille-P7918 TaxID=2479843 RepID=UPI003561C8F6
MAKSKVINTVLNLRDNMSGGLLKAARNAKKAGADIDDSMISATRQVVAFKNKAVDGITSFAKTAMGVGVAGVTALTTAFIALDGATEEYCINQGKLLTAFADTATGAQGARTAYSELYKILGDSDTSTEAAQALSTLAKSQQDVTKWTRVAAGVVGKFGDGISINSLFQDIGETTVSGSVTGALADALNWLNISEDEFNERLEATGTTAGRTTLILDTLTAAYDGYADAFYQNNTQLVKSRAYQTQVNNTLAKLGEASATAKNGVMQLLGAQEDGSYRAGSALEWLDQKATAFSNWVAGLNVGALTDQFDQGFATAVEKAGQAFDWVQENGDTIISVLKTIAAAWGIAKVVQFTGSVISAGTTIFNFVKTAGVLISANPIVIGIGLAIAAGALLIANWDKIKAGASALWEKAKETFGGIKDSIVGAFDSAKEKVSGFFSWLDDKIESIPLLGSLYSGGKSALSWIGGKLTGNALGTSYWRGGLTRVNERGGEIMNLPSGTQIIPHDISARMAGGPRVTVHVTVAGNVIGNEQYADEMGERIADKVIRAIDNM